MGTLVSPGQTPPGLRESLDTGARCSAHKPYISYPAIQQKCKFWEHVRAPAPSSPPRVKKHKKKPPQTKAQLAGWGKERRWNIPDQEGAAWRCQPPGTRSRTATQTHGTEPGREQEGATQPHKRLRKAPAPATGGCHCPLSAPFAGKACVLWDANPAAVLGDAAGRNRVYPDPKRRHRVPAANAQVDEM